jgi:PHS family inorganic phosphate transporter-like MFS transporter
MALVFALLGILENSLKASSGGRILMLLLYGLTFFFSNFGPNSTTFILPSETFPPHIRTTLNGFSAAMGKAGATLGSSVFKPLKIAVGIPWTMLCCAFISLLGFILTYFFVEDRRGKDIDADDTEKEAAIN